MEATFNNLKNQGKNTLDGLIQWLKDAKIIDGVKLTEEKARSLLAGVDPKNIPIDKFEDALNKMAAYAKEKPDDFKDKLRAVEGEVKKRLDEAHETGKLNVSGLKHKLDDISKAATAKVNDLERSAEAATSAAVGQAKDAASSAVDDIQDVIEKNKKKAEDLAKSLASNFFK